MYMSTQYNLKRKQDQIRARLDALSEAARREQARRAALHSEIWQPEFRGAALEIQSILGKHHEVMISGPAETGKTFACCYLVDTILRHYNNVQGVLARKIRATIVGSVLQTYLKITDKRGGTSIYGGSEPQWIDYANGSRLWIVGLDKPGNALSTERDIVYINQAEETNVADWETLLTRATGRAGNLPHALMLGDCNPTTTHHWRHNRKSLHTLKSYHKDNPRLFNNDGTITEQGHITLDVLAGLSEPRRSRLFLGLDASVEGQVYKEYDENRHVIARYAIPTDWPCIRVIDFGFKNPFVCSWYAVAPNGIMVRYREIYRTQTLVEDHARKIAECEGWEYSVEYGTITWHRPISARENIIATICDHDAEDRATLERYGIKTIPAIKYIKLGIEAVQQRLKAATVVFMRDSLVEIDTDLDTQHLPKCTEDEFEGYVYPENKNNNKATPELPIDKLNHGMDTLRYAVAFIDDLGIELEDIQETVEYDEDYTISPY